MEVIRYVTKKIYSLDPDTYPDVNAQFVLFDSPQDLLKKATKEEVIVASKVAPVKIRYAKVGDVVDTRPRIEYKGKVYTFSEVTRKVDSLYDKNGSRMVIVTNPDGEEYLQPETKTRQKYNVTGEISETPQVVIPKGVRTEFRQTIVNAVVNVWGEPWFVTVGGYVTNDLNDCYPITNVAFKNTYVVENNHGDSDSREA